MDKAIESYRGTYCKGCTIHPRPEIDSQFCLGVRSAWLLLVTSTFFNVNATASISYW